MMNKELSVDGALSVADEKTNSYSVNGMVNSNRRPRTSEDFYLFCTYVLQHENYESKQTECKVMQQDGRNAANQSPPLDSSGSSVNSDSTNSAHGDDDKRSGDDSANDEDDEDDEDNDEDDSFDLVTCFCGKPFAGRPMIECSICLTWIHLSCARIKKSNIPDVFHCAMCKSSSSSKKQRSASPPPYTDKAVKRPKRTTPPVMQDV